MSTDRSTLTRGVKLVAEALGVHSSEVRAALRPLRAVAAGETVRRDGALALLTSALASTPLRIVAHYPGRPQMIDIEAKEPVAIGHGVVEGDLLDGDFAPLVLTKGQRARAALFVTSKRMANLAQLTVTPPKASHQYDTAFLFLPTEARVWNINRKEILRAEKEARVGEAWQRIRRLSSGALRFELPKKGSDWELAARLGPIPTRRP